MWEIEKEFDDYSHPLGKSGVHLNPDQALNPYSIEYPVVWFGFVGGEKVKILQLEAFAGSLDSFDFKEFPEKYDNLKTQIIQWIDDKLRTMD